MLDAPPLKPHVLLRLGTPFPIVHEASTRQSFPEGHLENFVLQWVANKIRIWGRNKEILPELEKFLVKRPSPGWELSIAKKWALQGHVRIEDNDPRM